MATQAEAPRARQNETPEIERFLQVRKWKRDVNFLGEIEYVSPSDEWQVQLSKDGWWAIQRFTDSDIQVQDVGAVATARWITESEGQLLTDLRDELVSLGAIEWECPNCGETGGQPRTAYSREWQGCTEHGGPVTWEDEGCSKCIKGSDPETRYDCADDAGSGDREAA